MEDILFREVKVRCKGNSISGRVALSLEGKELLAISNILVEEDSSLILDRIRISLNVPSFCISAPVPSTRSTTYVRRRDAS